MSVIMNPARLIIENMGGYYSRYCGDEKPSFIFNEKQFYYKKGKTHREDDDWCKTVVMFFPAMVKGIKTYYKCYYNHGYFKRMILDKLNTENGQAS
jgi:hypothetical protein